MNTTYKYSPGTIQHDHPFFQNFMEVALRPYT